MPKKASVTIVCSSSENNHVDDLRAELTNVGITTDIVDFDPTRPLVKGVKKLGDVTIWRSSSLHNRIQRPGVGNYLDKTYMINEAVFLQPSVAEKYYQQQTLASTPGLRDFVIPTYRVKGKKSFQKLIDNQTLSLPVIAKPNGGCRGEGITLIRKVADVDALELNVGDYVFQQFIENDGDWRVIIIGGRPIGAMKRLAQNGSFLNNISQGAHAVTEQDPEILEVLYKIAPKTAALFRLRFCGVDIIRNAKTGEYRVLEVNTIPQWMNERGFTNTTGVSVAKKVAEYVKTVLDWKASKDLPATVDAYFKNSLELYPYDLFHYASRRWLWSRDAWSQERLIDMKEWYLGKDEAAYREKIVSLCTGNEVAQSVNQNKVYRQKYYEKYTNLALYNSLLFRYLFARTLYGVDLKSYIQEQVPDADFLEVFNQLLNDHDAIRVLSTHAINYFYLLKNYLGTEVDPQLFLTMSDEYDHLVASGELKASDAQKLKIYLLTHAIIGESLFYSRPVNGEVYTEMCRRVEASIESQYFTVSLDNKFEFLVCAALCGYKTRLRSLILQEAEGVVSWAGPFIVDRDAQAVRHVVQSSEHRNVLYVMASETEAFRKKGDTNVYGA